MSEQNQNRKVGDEVDPNELKEIREEFREEPETVSLNINRVPKYVSDQLKDEANEFFAGDYGMALTFWFREQRSLEVMKDRIEDLEERIDYLEKLLTETLNSDDDEDEDEGPKTLN